MRKEGRRAVRRRETIDEILAAAVDLMAADGVGALSLAGVARRVGVRPPSLYQYFPSKLAVYDALFVRGMRELTAAMRASVADLPADDPLAAIRTGVRAFVAWAVSHQVHAQIMFWRPVPGFVPSAAAYAAAVESLDLLRVNLRAAAEAGLLAPEAADERAVDLCTTVVAGAISQQLANEPAVATPDGRFARLAPVVIDLVLASYAPRPPGRAEP
jgi:AcrR family transcriptional regulator